MSQLDKILLVQELIKVLFNSGDKDDFSVPLIGIEKKVRLPKNKRYESILTKYRELAGRKRSEGYLISEGILLKPGEWRAHHFQRKATGGRPKVSRPNAHSLEH